MTKPAFVQPQLFTFNFAGGLDTKTDPLQLPGGKFLELENVVFTKTGEIRKRNGYAQLSKKILGGGSIQAGAALSSFNSELCLFDGHNVFSYSAATGNWLDRGDAVSIITTNRRIVRTSNEQQLNPDVAVQSGMEIYVWEDSEGGIRYSVLDQETRTFCVADALVDATAGRPKVMAFDGLFYIFYSDLINNLFYRTVNPFNPTILTSPQVLITDGYADFGYDVAKIGDRLFFAYLSQDVLSGSIRAFYCSSGFVKSSVVDVDQSSAIEDGYSSTVNVAKDSNNQAWISWSTGTEVRTSCHSYQLVNVLPSTMVDGYFQCTYLAGIESETPQTLLLCYSQHDDTPSNYRTHFKTISAAGSVSSASTVRSVGLVSKPFVYDDARYVNVAHDSPFQNTYFTLSLDADPISVVAKVSPATGGGLRTNGMLSEVVETSDGIFLWSNLVQGKSISESNVNFTFLGVNSTRFNFADSNRFMSETINNNLMMVGGIVQSYDGVSTVEYNFHLYPEGIEAVATGSDGQLSVGSYQYVATYEWSDNLGQVQFSKPSVPVTVTVTANKRVDLTIPTLRLTAKQNSRSSVKIVIYRTEVNGSIFRRVTSSLAPLQNDITVDAVTFSDRAADADILSNEPLYSTGILENAAPPACSIICTHQGRIFLSGLDDPNLIVFSKNRFDNSNFNTIPTEFCDELRIGVDPRGGAITALGVLYDKLIIFKESAIFWMAGEGPNDAGGGQQYGEPQFLTADVGCNNPNSVRSTPFGLFFKSSKGIYLLDNSLPQYVGADVENFNDLTITSSSFDPSGNRVIFLSSEGTALVFDYERRAWCTWTYHSAEDCDFFQGKFCFLRPDGTVYQQEPDRYDDAGGHIRMSVTTPNLPFGDLQGLYRVLRMMILGTYQSNHSLDIAVAFDGSPTFTKFATVDASQDVELWGDGEVWGDGYVWGGEFIPYQHRIDITARCRSIRVRIRDSQEAPYGQGMSLSALTFEAGLIPGLSRVHHNKIVGIR